MTQILIPEFKVAKDKKASVVGFTQRGPCNAAMIPSQEFRI